ELGYELYIPAEQATHVYDQVVAAGAQFGLRHAGLKALASLRMEKGYRDYGHDIDNTDDPYDVGLGYFIALNKSGGFLGKEALLARNARGPRTRQLAQLLVKDSEPLLFHAEVVYRDGQAVGYIRAGSYGFTLGGAVGLFMTEAAEPVDEAYVATGRWEIDIAGTRYPAEVSLTPMYDPEMKKIKA
ncbi:MAG: aminomethyltransferase family protein, partial [Anaerolineales bacterium]|nr:aminomethyltransferase family protein [Anaerolineales bacterium]